MAGSNPALIVRVAATIEELKKNLAEGVSQIETTTAGMQRLAASFSGDKLIQQAMNVTAAVNQIGGASKLTDAEMARVNSTIERALEKYATLGREAPAGMRQLADDTKQVETVSGTLTDTVKSLVVGFAAMFTARAAFNFVKDTVDEASALKNLGTQVHINVEELQLLAGGMSEFGVNADELGKGLFRLSRGIAGGEESVATGLHLMGLSLQDVDGLQGKELFLRIEAGLATLQGGLRDTAATELFGSKLGAAMAGASEGIEGALATWLRLNHVASTESVDALDAFGSSIARADKNVSSIATNMIGPLAEGFNVLFDAATKGASTWDLILGLLPKGLGLVGTGTEGLATAIDHLNLKTDEQAAATRKAAEAHEAVTKAVDTRTAAEKFMAALETDAAAALTTSQLTNLAHLKAIGALTSANAAGIGVTAAQFDHYKASIEAAKKAEEELKKTSEEARKLEAAGLLATTKLWDEYFALRVAHGGTANEIAIAQIDKWAADLTAQMIKAGTATDGFYTALAAVSKEKMNAVGTDFEEAYRTRSIPALRELAARNLQTYRDMVASGAFFREDLDKQLAKWRELDAASRNYGDTAVDAQTRARLATQRQNEELARSKALADAAAFAIRQLAGGSQQVTAQNFGESIADIVTGMSGGGGLPLVVQHGLDTTTAFALAKQGLSFEQIVNVLRGGPMPTNPGPRIPGFAGGVENYAGGWAMVGERGPEAMYVPPGASIAPHGSGAGATIVQHIYITQPFGTPAQLARVFDDAVMARQRAIGTRF